VWGSMFPLWIVIISALNTANLKVNRISVHC
jgi:hypothetical protein